VGFKFVVKREFVQAGFDFPAEADAKGVKAGGCESLGKIVYCYVCVGTYEEWVGDLEMDLWMSLAVEWRILVI